jgi:SAM-dependent methyltransferase
VTDLRADGARYYLTPEEYDLVYADYVADVGPHVASCRAAGGRVLEVCCGNGRLLIPALEAGVPCEGLDLDPTMLDDLRRKLAARGLSAQLHHGDMRDFALPGRYRLVVIPFNSFLHNLTQEDQLRTLRRCREHLEPGGALEVVAFHPLLEHLLALDRGEQTTKDVPDPRGGRVRVVDRADTDRVEQVRTLTRRIEFVSGDGTVTETRTTRFRIRYAWKPEMELLLRVAGFARWEARPRLRRFNDAGPLDPTGPIREGDVIAWTAWRD